MSFAGITVRENGKKIYASWFNDIRSKLIAIFGSGAMVETQFTIADNQSSYQSITGLLLDHTVARAYDIEYTIYRTDGSNERRERGVLFCTYKAVAGEWSFSRRTHHGDDALNIANSLNISTAGQGEYKSDSMGGTYVGLMRYKVLISFNKET